MMPAVSEDVTENRRGNRFRHSWSRELVIERMQEWNQLFGKPPAQSEWNIAKARTLLVAARRRALRWVDVQVEYERGDWPSCDTVKRLFGSWNNAVEAAGFDRRPSGNTPSKFKIRHKYAAHVDALTDIQYGVAQIEKAAASRDIGATRQAIEDLASISLAWLEHFDAGIPR